jgi:hypothetical protein
VHRGSILFSEKDMGHLTLREALASGRLDAFVREQQDEGAELATGSELERGLALLITQRLLIAPKDACLPSATRPMPRNRSDSSELTVLVN